MKYSLILAGCDKALGQQLLLLPKVSPGVNRLAYMIHPEKQAQVVIALPLTHVGIKTPAAQSRALSVGSQAACKPLLQFARSLAVNCSCADPLPKQAVTWL